MKMTQVELMCAVCSNRSYIWRKSSKLKEPGHVKHMWCPVCCDVRPHKEVRK